MATSTKPPSTGSGTPVSIPGVNYGVISPTVVPDFNALLQYALGQTHPNVPSFQDTISQGVNSPIFQSIIQPALSNLLPGEELARSSLMDEFRSAGGLGSGAMGVASARLENALQGQRGNLISQVLANFLPNLVSGYGLQSQNAFRPADLINQILGMSRPQMITSGANQGGGAMGGGSPSIPGFDVPNLGYTPGVGSPYNDPGSGGPNPFSSIQYPGTSMDPLMQFAL